MATPAQAQELLENLDEKVEELKKAVDALTKASGRVSRSKDEPEAESAKTPASASK